MGAVHICLSCTPCSHTSCQHVAVSEHAATCTVGSFVELRVWQWTAGNVEEAGITVVEQSRVDTQKAVFISSCLAVPNLYGLFLPCFTLRNEDKFLHVVALDQCPLTASSPGSQKLALIAQLVMYPAFQETSVLLMLYSQMNMNTNLLGQQILSSPEMGLEVLLDRALKCIEYYWVGFLFFFF